MPFFSSFTFLRREIFLFPLLAAVSLFAAACARRPAPPAQAPAYETLLLLLSDFRRFSQADLYRQNAPIDLSGQNFFRATLARLDYFQMNHPGRDADIVDYTRAQARARLGDYLGAAEAFSRVAEMKESPLAAKAGERAEIMKIFRDATKPVEFIESLAQFLGLLEARRKELGELEKSFAGTYDAILARRELEKTDQEYALALFRNRHVLEAGAPRALEFAKGMVGRHSESRLVHSHRLTLGLFYFELARDLATLTPPDRTGFDSRLFHELATAARREFLVVSRADGYEEKLEAAAQLRALEAYTGKIRGLER